jgi:low temperature requirement protein LtrA
MRIALSRERGAEREVSPLELFFDLVYVFAIGQLSHHLVEQWMPVRPRPSRPAAG